MNIFIGIYAAIVAVSYLLPYSTSIRIAAPMQGVGLLFLVYIGIVYMIRKNRLALYFVPGLIAMLVGVGLMTFKNIGLLQHSVLTLWSYPIGISFQAVLFSFALADKLNTLKNELRDMNINLEQKVQTRTEELSVAYEEMRVINEDLIEVKNALWGDMQLAKKIQTVLLPKYPSVPGYEITGYMSTADEVGGDYYDVIAVGGYHWFVIGDVSGHGVPAGLVMMMVQTAIHNSLEQNPDNSPAKMLTIINRTIAENVKNLNEDKYMTITVFAAQEDGKFIISGLHQDILIYRAETGTIDSIETKGMWLGLFDDISGMLFNDTLQLHHGDTMLLYTDGITEAWKNESSKGAQNPDDEMFGMERLQDVFGKNAGGSLPDIKNRIVAALADYTCNDDVTLLIVRRL